MKICIYSDPHWSTYSSILRQRGRVFSKRLETLIDSVNWVERLAEQQSCSWIYCLGDFFDRNILTAEEITALNEIKWADKPHTFIVGNHEITKDDLLMNSMNVLSKYGKVVNKPTYNSLENGNLYLIPYVDEDNRKPLRDTMLEANPKYNYQSVNEKNIILSHNDIKGIRYGAYVSEMGWGIDEIENNCNLYLNGHLHNGQWVSHKILNVGNLSGQNFTEDGFKHSHCAFILDTDTLELQAFENPYAIYFYKVDIFKENDLSKLYELKNACVSITVKESLINEVKEEVKSLSNIITHRTVIVPNDELVVETNSEELLGKVNHLDKLNDFILIQLGNFDIVKYELEKICNWKGKE